MQGKAKKKRVGVTERLRARDASVAKRRLLWLFWELTWGGFAYLIGLGSMLFDAKPLGVALICASHGHLLGILGGLVLSELMLMEQPILMIATYASATLIRAVSSILLEGNDARVSLPARIRKKLRPTEEGEANSLPERRGEASGRFAHLSQAFQSLRREFGGLFTESLKLRAVTAAVSMLVVSLFRIISGGFRYYDLFAALFSVTVAPAATVVFSVRLEEHPERKLLRAASSAALMYSLVWSANNAAIVGIPVSAVLALFIAFLAVEQGGTAWGAIAGLICGLAYEPAEAPAFLLAALIYGGIKWKRPETFGVPLSCLGALIWSVYAKGGAEFAVAIPAYLMAGTAFTVYLCIKKRRTEDAEKTEDPEAELRRERIRHEDSNDRFRNISDAFSALSEMFYNLSDRLRRPGTLDLRRICDGSFDSFCADCPNRTVCWGLEYSDTLGVVNSLISRLHTKGKVLREQIPEHMLNRCHSMDRILMQINAECARFTGELLRNNRTEIFAMDYEAAANIINDALAEDDGEYKFDTDLEDRLMDYLSDAGIAAQSVSVYGMRRRQILVRGVNVDRSTVTMETLRSDLGEMCGLELSAPSFEVEGNVSTMILGARKKLAVIGAHKNLSADGGVSGDTVNLFSNRKDYFYALISDGMGAGREAAFTSNLCSTFLEKMLRAGNRAGTSLRMLNNLILSRCSDSAEECSSTIDLIELDLVTGKASFIKGGAAPSFVIRGGTVHRLQAGTAPIGIIPKLDTQTSCFELRAGDTVVMVSDGILQDDVDGKLLAEYLSNCGEIEPEALAEELCRRAAEQEKHDDCSAVALRITSAEE